MITKYIIEYWNSNKRKYQKMYESYSFEWTEKMFNKPYNQFVTRRLIKITEEILYKKKSNKK